MPPSADAVLSITGIITLAYLCAGLACLLVERHQMRLIVSAAPEERCDPCAHALLAYADFRMQMAEVPVHSRWVVHAARLLVWPFDVFDQAVHLPPLHRCTRTA